MPFRRPAIGLVDNDQLPSGEGESRFQIGICLAWYGHRAAMSAPRAAAQLLRLPVSLAYSFRPLLRGWGRRGAPALPSRYRTHGNHVLDALMGFCYPAEVSTHV